MASAKPPGDPDSTENVESEGTQATTLESQGVAAERRAASSNRELQSDNDRDLSFPIEESVQEFVEQNQSDIFKQLLDAICQHFPIHNEHSRSNVNKLIAWADLTYGIKASDIMEILNELVWENIIGPLNLSVLRDIFEAMGQIHLVHLVDNYVLGDYHLLNRSPNHHKRSANAPGVRLNNEESPSLQRKSFSPRNLSTTHGSKLSLGSNGQKLSKLSRQNLQRNIGSNPQDSDDPDGDVNKQWLCNHCKRHCLVKFACCDQYWPCHRCHNNESNCSQKNLRSIHTKFVKCVKCGTEQEFSERSQFCGNCNMKFAKYFCHICKHLTEKDDKPYHCDKCGICRIHKHRWFHCDVCGVCLDVQLRDNHKCRAGSAHDECCFCLQDAFIGCQILPCSHKVHKECAAQMIGSGITRCPICRKSFHKV